MLHPDTLTQPIDAVITWVDGTAQPDRRAAFMAQASGPLHANSTNPHRWADNDEILYCLQSIENHAPWVRTIWIVSDTYLPDLTRLSPAMRARIRHVSHGDIFAEFEGALPTFNSLAIESLLWRIDGLADQFMYFNDDVFLTAPLDPHDVFQSGAPVLRGKWADYSGIAQDAGARDDPARFNHFMQINAATLAGFDAQHLFATAHVVHPMRRDVMADLFDAHPRAFAANVAHRFRDITQFLPQGAHNHACIASGHAILLDARDHLHIRSGQGAGAPPGQMRRLMADAQARRVKFICVNDLPQLEHLVPEARAWVSRSIGGFHDDSH